MTAVGGGGHDQRAQAVPVIEMARLGQANGQPLQRVTEGLGRDQVEQRAAQAEIAGDMQDLERMAVVEEDLVIEGADQNTLVEIAQHRLEPVLLAFDPGGRIGDRALDIGPSAVESCGHVARGGCQRTEIAGAMLVDLPPGAAMGDRPQVSSEALDRPRDMLVEFQPDPDHEPCDGENRPAAEQGERSDGGLADALDGEGHGGRDDRQGAERDQREEQKDPKPETPAFAHRRVSPRRASPAPWRRGRGWRTAWSCSRRRRAPCLFRPRCHGPWRSA